MNSHVPKPALRRYSCASTHDTLKCFKAAPWAHALAAFPGQYPGQPPQACGSIAGWCSPVPDEGVGTSGSPGHSQPSPGPLPIYPPPHVPDSSVSDKSRQEMSPFGLALPLDAAKKMTQRVLFFKVQVLELEQQFWQQRSLLVCRPI